MRTLGARWRRAHQIGAEHISTERVAADAITGTKRACVIVQCKHWQTKSISLPEVSVMLNSVGLWEPPRVDVLMIATSGNFTADALQYIESHNEQRKHPAIENARPRRP